MNPLASLRFLFLLAVLGASGRGAAAVPRPLVPSESQRVQLLLNINNDSALLRSRRLVGRATQKGHPADLAEAYWLLGSALRNQSRFDSSLYYAQRALTLFSTQGHPAGVANAYTLMAQTYKRVADAQHVASLTHKALALAGQAVAAARQGQALVSLSRAYLIQGIIFRDLHEYDSARVCYQRSIALALKHPGLPSSLPVGYADYGQLLMDADHDLVGAIHWFRLALPLYQREDNRNGLEHAYRQLSWAYRQQHRPVLAVQVADTCLALGRASGDLHRLGNSLQAAYLAYRAAARWPQALALLEEWKSLTDTQARADIAAAVASRQATYELEQQAERLVRLGQANARQRRGLWGLGLGTCLLLTLLGVTGWQYRIIRQTNARLQASNQTVHQNNLRIGEQSERLAMLLREVHHRVKNNLAIVASLLRLQASRLTDPEAARAMRESQQRVEAMSLIHQGLYQTEDVTAVDMRRYVADLAQSLSTAYGFSSADFDLTIEVAPVRLDVDQAVPLGLFLNELLTNAFKHAIGRPRAGRAALRIALGPVSTGGLLLEVQDNGPGFDPTALGPRPSFGQRLLTALAGQLSGELTVDSTSGTRCQLALAVVPVAPMEIGDTSNLKGCLN